MELMHHSPKATNYEVKPDGNVGFGGQQNGEMLVKHFNTDPLRSLMGSGFNVQAPLGVVFLSSFTIGGNWLRSTIKLDLP